MSTLTAEQGRIAYQGQRRIDAKERREHVARLTRAGHSAAEIAVRLGVTPRTVHRDRRATGTAQPEPTPMTDREHAIVQRLLADGASCAEAGRTIGRSKTTILRHYPEHAWTRKQVGELLRIMHLERSIR